jgi:hypothetical protein
LLLPFVGVSDLLFFSAFGSLASAVVVRKIIGRYQHSVDHPGQRPHGSTGIESRGHQAPAAHKRGVIQTLVRHPYLASLALVAFFAFFATTCIDYGFFREIERKYGSETSIASFLAIFLGATRLVSLLLKVGVVGRLFNRFGLARTSLILPLALAVVTIVGLLWSSSIGQVAAIWFFSINMLLVELWAEAVHVPALNIALQPLHLHERHEGRYAISDVIEPLALGCAAILIYGLSTLGSFSLQSISAVVLTVVIAWMGAIAWMERQYKETIRRALKHRRIDAAEMVWDDVTRRVIEQKLASSHHSEVEYALQLIPKSESRFFLARFPRLLEHKSMEIRKLALQRAEEFEFSPKDREHLSLMLEKLMEDRSADPAFLGQLLHTYTAMRHDLPPTALQEWLVDERPQIREGLISGLIRFQGIDGILLAGEILQVMLGSVLPGVRKAAAEIVGRVGMRQFYHPLLKLFGDEDAEVRMAAARAAAQVGHPHLIRPLIDLYLVPTLSRPFVVTIETALRGFGNAVFPYLADRIEEGVFDSSRLQRMMRLLGFWGTPRSVELLTAFLTWPVTHRRTLGELRLAALRAMVQAGITLPDRHLVNRLLEEELSRVRSMIALLFHLESSWPDTPSVTMQNTESVMLLRSALSTEIVSSAHRVVLLLGVMYDAPTIVRVRDSIFAGNDLHRANALETLDSLLPKAQSTPVIALLEAALLLGGKKADVATLHDLFPHSSADRHDSPRVKLEHFIRDEDRFYDPWTIATAIYLAGTTEWNTFAAEILRVAERPDLAGSVAQMLLSHHGENFVQLPESAQREMIVSSSQTFFKYQSDGEPMPILFERVILLKTVDLFRETPDSVLSHVAQAMEEVHVAQGVTFIRKGELGTCLYIIEEGAVRVHDGDHLLAHLASRQVVGELALLDPEPRSASVTAEEDTTLLKLDWEVFYDLMVDNVEIARGAIATLCRRIRTQNEKLAGLAAPATSEQMAIAQTR